MFLDMILSGSDKDLMDSVKGSLTDNGLCTTINSKSIAGTFKMENKRIRSFAKMLNKTSHHEGPRRIKGSGYLQRSTFWLYAGGSSNTGFADGKIVAAINNWNEYLSVRCKNENNIEAMYFNL